MVKRILASIILLAAVLYMPFWISLILALIGMAFFPIYLEAVALFFLQDLLYAVAETRIFGIFFVSSAICFFLLVTAEFLKKRLKFYP